MTLNDLVNKYGSDTVVMISNEDGDSSPLVVDESLVLYSNKVKQLCVYLTWDYEADE